MPYTALLEWRPPTDLAAIMPSGPWKDGIGALLALAERGVQATLTDSARELIANMGYDPTYGARPLRRVIQKQLTDRLALALLEGTLREGDSVEVDARNGELTLDSATAAAREAAAAS